MVSIIRRSTPAATRARICSAKAARASSRPVLPSGSRRTPSGPDRTRNPGLAGLLVIQVLDSLAGQSHTGRVDFSHFAAQAMPGQAESIGAEGVGFKNFSPGLQVLLMDGEDQSGIGEVQLVVAAVDEDTAPVDHGSHGPVGENWPVGEDVGELRHSFAMLSYARPARQPASLLCYTSDSH